MWQKLNSFTVSDCNDVAGLENQSLWQRLNSFKQNDRYLEMVSVIRNIKLKNIRLFLTFSLKISLYIFQLILTPRGSGLPLARNQSLYLLFSYIQFCILQPFSSPTALNNTVSHSNSQTLLIDVNFYLWNLQEILDFSMKRLKLDTIYSSSLLVNSLNSFNRL